MTNEQVIRKFLAKEKGKTPKRLLDGGIYCYYGNTLTSNGQELINYNTIIARHIGDVVLLNIAKYSATTSKIQSMIKRICSELDIECVHCGSEQELKNHCGVFSFDDELKEVN